MIIGAGSRMRVTARSDNMVLLEVDENGDGRFDKSKQVRTQDVFARDCQAVTRRVLPGGYALTGGE